MRPEGPVSLRPSKMPSPSGSARPTPPRTTPPAPPRPTHRNRRRIFLARGRRSRAPPYLPGPRERDGTCNADAFSSGSTSISFTLFAVTLTARGSTCRSPHKRARCRPASRGLSTRSAGPPQSTSGFCSVRAAAASPRRADPARLFMRSCDRCRRAERHVAPRTQRPSCPISPPASRSTSAP